MRLFKILILMFAALAMASCAKPAIDATATGVEGLPVDSTPCALPAAGTATALAADVTE